MKEFKWGSLGVATVLIVLSGLIYYVQVQIFQDAKTTSFYFLQDLAFTPLQVFFVTFVLNQLMNRREKQKKLKQINIVRSAFFNEAGSKLIESMAQFSTNIDVLKEQVKQTDWVQEHELNLQTVQKFEHIIDSQQSDLLALKHFLDEKKDYLLSVIQNQNLLEHDAFTDMLWAVYHVMDELENRENDQIETLPELDLVHLSRDFERAFKLLVIEWTIYMRHLKVEYPYLFSLALRKNPFSEQQVIFE